MRYREKLLGNPPPRWLEDYTSSIRDDRVIFQEAVWIHRVHVVHLAEKGLIPAGPAASLLKMLRAMRPEDVLKDEYEDVFEAIEAALQEKAPGDAGYLPLGRSRNDHVAAVLRLKTLRLLIALLAALIRLRKTLIQRAGEWMEYIVPAHTHLQPAQPTSLAHYALAVEEGVADAWGIVYRVMVDVVDASPLGSAASTGTSVPLDRARLAKLAGFSRVIYNTLYATSSRLFLLHAASSVHAVFSHLSRAASDLVVWSHPSLGYIRLCKRHLATSSIMPHKRNPATMEVLRARAAESLGDLVSISGIVLGLPTGYSLDLQEASRHAWRIILEAYRASRVLEDAFSCAEPTRRGEEDAARFPTTAPDIAEALSLEKGVPFREAYNRVASLLAEGLGVEEIGERILGRRITPRESLEMKSVSGSPGENWVKDSINKARKRLLRDVERLEAVGRRLSESTRTLLEAEDALMDGGRVEEKYRG